MLPVDQLRKRRKIPDGLFFPRDRMLPTFGHVGDRLAVDADRDLKRLGLAPVNDQRIGALVSRRVELARLDTGNMHPRR